MKLETLLIGLGGAIVGGALSLLGAYLKGRAEIAKVRMEYDLNRNDRYLENARLRINDLYIPLYRLVSQLYNCYLELRDISAAKGGELGEIGEVALEKLRGAYTRFDAAYVSWIHSGATSYFVYDLEEKCVLLRNLIRGSLAEPSVHVVREILVSLSTPIYTARWRIPFFSKQRFIEQADVSKSKSSFDIELPLITRFSLLGFGTAFRKQILSAPVTSREFEGQFIQYIIRIKETVREVILGKA